LASLLFGGQLMSIGFVAELVTAHLSREMRAYSIAERVNEPEGQESEVGSQKSGTTHR